MDKTARNDSRVLISVIMLLIALIATSVTAPSAHAATEGPLTYVIEDGQAIITKCDAGTVGPVSIPSTLESSPVTAIGGSAFYSCIKITSVSLPSTISRIGSNAFSGCSRLETINLPNSITSIGEYAFNNCSSLKSATLPSAITEVEKGAFARCSDLKSVITPSTLKSIGEYAFTSCSSLTSIDLHSVEKIGSNAFWSTGLTSVNIPASVTELGSFAFYGCSNLTDVTLKASTPTITSNAFGYCTSLESIVIPSSVTSIDTNAFAGCNNLRAIFIPTSVLVFSDHAFDFCDKLKDVHYAGTKAQWDKLSLGKRNSQLVNARKIYSAKGITPIYIPLKRATFKTDGVKAHYELLGRSYTDAKCQKEIKDPETWNVIPKLKSATLSSNLYTYNGKTRNPKVIVKDEKGNTVSSKYYKVSKPKNHKAIGTYTYKVTFKGNYSGNKTLKFTIGPKGTSITSVSSVGKSFTVTWKKQTAKMPSKRITGYQIRYSTSYAGKFKIKTIKGYGKAGARVSGLPPAYVSVQVRTYIKTGGKTYYSPWSASKNTVVY